MHLVDILQRVEQLTLTLLTRQTQPLVPHSETRLRVHAIRTEHRKPCTPDVVVDEVKLLVSRPRPTEQVGEEIRAFDLEWGARVNTLLTYSAKLLHMSTIRHTH